MQASVDSRLIYTSSTVFRNAILMNNDYPSKPSDLRLLEIKIT